jgi:hypothetical protein
MRSKKHWLLALCLLHPLLMGDGCEDTDNPPPDCDERIGAQAKGSWTITAHGSRENCGKGSEDLEGDLNIKIEEFSVDGTPIAAGDHSGGESDDELPADAFVERVKRAQYQLSASVGAPAGLQFSGSVNTCQITFTVRENLPRGQFHEFTFTGFSQDAYHVIGRFTGHGPGACTSSGKFDVQIR